MGARSASREASRRGSGSACAAGIARTPRFPRSSRVGRLSRGAAPSRPRCTRPTLALWAVARADRKHKTGSSACADDRVVRTWRAVDEVPLPDRPLFSLDDEKRFTREHEEVFLSGFPVVHRHRLARLQKSEVNPELLEPRLALEIAQRAKTTPLPPLRLACVENEPTSALRDKAAFRLDQLRLNDHSRRACHLRFYAALAWAACGNVTRRDGRRLGTCDRWDDGDGIRERPTARPLAAWLPRGPARCRGCGSHRPHPATRETTTSTPRRCFVEGKGWCVSPARSLPAGQRKISASPQPVPANPGSPSSSFHMKVVFHPSDSNQARLPRTSDTFRIGLTERTVESRRAYTARSSPRLWQRAGMSPDAFSSRSTVWRQGRCRR